MRQFITTFFVGALLVALLTSCAAIPPAPEASTVEPAASVPSVPQATALEVTPAPIVPPPASEALQVPVAAPPAPAVPQAEKNKNGLAFGGQIFLAVQNWSKVGMSSDSKMGVGLGGSFGIGFQLDDMKVTVGPSMWSNMWSANYSQKSQSATSSVYVTMNDAGVSLTSYFDDMFLEMGTGNSTIKSGMMVNGVDITYPYHGTSYTYKTFSIGMKSGPVLFGLGIKNYSGYASAANHVNFMIGLGF